MFIQQHVPANAAVVRQANAPVHGDRRPFQAGSAASAGNRNVAAMPENLPTDGQQRPEWAGKVPDGIHSTFAARPLQSNIRKKSVKIQKNILFFKNRNKEDLHARMEDFQQKRNASLSSLLKAAQAANREENDKVVI